MPPTPNSLVNDYYYHPHGPGLVNRKRLLLLSFAWSRPGKQLHISIANDCHKSDCVYFID
jgi:hypothetical protein